MVPAQRDLHRLMYREGRASTLRAVARRIERTDLVKPAESSELVSAVMSTKIVAVKPTDRAHKALQAMVRHRIGSIVVVEKGKPVGILTERDVTRRIAKGQNVRGMVIRNIMSKPLITIEPSAEVWQAVERMVKKEIRRLLVMDGNKLVGIITERDIFRWVITSILRWVVTTDWGRT
jgi:CBS domain-containing protein